MEFFGDTPVEHRRVVVVCFNVEYNNHELRSIRLGNTPEVVLWQVSSLSVCLFVCESQVR